MYGGFKSQEELDQWGEDQQKWLQYQAPLREKAFFDPSASPEEKAEAKRLLDESIAKLTDKWPPITGEFHYTQEDVKEAKRNGF